ncbi:N-acetylmuramoyl-L-alanine amidase [Streptomyces sp. N2-109]|uniref:N-acetylmuramoyl-L-alanine amidase n=1 Tax=Streptomyces gossypii TaxID=2883101 RepID=A0ABT2JTG0_9ACTN|nr:N-acetylmuramoyl-L-alanine amidase [Streptomyces gossypii]MCT2591157.1 N-acetylmuramoyl-L-alanine amidase [Streptomyces gossypii]
MATPLSADRLLAALRAEGVKVREHPGWRSHDRNHKGAWGGVNGLVIHHTAGVDSLGLCWGGTAALPGPLCHTHLSKAGTATMLSAGRANHAGSFARNAHDAVVRESSKHPRPDSSEPIDGNRHYYGIEIENRGDGEDPYPKGQYEQAVRWAAAICRAHGWTADSVIGHKEGTRRKIDPSFSMTEFRSDVNERLQHSPSWGGDDEDQEDEDMAITDADVKRIARASADMTWNWDGVEPLHPTKANPTRQPENVLTSIWKQIDRTEKKVTAGNAAVAELAKALGARDELVDVDALVARIEAAIERVTVELNVPEGA